MKTQNFASSFFLPLTSPLICFLWKSKPIYQYVLVKIKVKLIECWLAFSVFNLLKNNFDTNIMQKLYGNHCLVLESLKRSHCRKRPFTAKKLKFTIKDFFSKCEEITFTEEVLNGKLQFLCSDWKVERAAFIPKMYVWHENDMKIMQFTRKVKTDAHGKSHVPCC